MEVLQIAVSQVCHLLGITARIVDVWEYMILESYVIEVAGVGHLALHFIVYNAFEYKLVFWFTLTFGTSGHPGVLWPNSPTFLGEIMLVE